MSSNETSSFDREYQALRTGHAVVELARWSSISVTGADRQAFLHNFCTNDVKRLVPGASCEAFFTNVKGKIVAHGVLNCRDDALVFVGAPGQGLRLAAHLDRYVIREDVKLRDTTEERNYLLVTGGLPVENSQASIFWDIVGRADAKLFEFEASQASDIVRRLVADGIVIVGSQAFEAARVESAFPLCDVDFDDSNLPQEVGREKEAISFTKGCYLGQETVARIDALGHVNQKIVGLRFSGTDMPMRGTELVLQDRSVGVVTSAAFSPKLEGPLALAMVRREASAMSTRLASPIGKCEVVALPLA